jgi:hypothetical protein
LSIGNIGTTPKPRGVDYCLYNILSIDVLIECELSSGVVAEENGADTRLSWFDIEVADESYQEIFYTVQSSQLNAA